MEAYVLPKKNDDYNSSYNNDTVVDTYRRFNEETGKIGQPEIVCKNVDFFSSLMISGVQPIGYQSYPVFSPHQRRFNVLAGLPLVHKGYNLPIERVEVPEIGYQEPHHNMFSDMMTYLGGGKVAGKGNHLAIRARPHIQGVECVVFNCITSSGFVSYMWDEATVRSVQSSHPVCFIKKNGVYYLVTDVPDSFVCTVPYKKVEWEILSKDLLERCVDGMVIDVDTTQYHVPVEVCVTLRAKVISGDVVLTDSNGSQYGRCYVPEGLYDVNVNTMEVRRSRGDKVYPDSTQMITVARTKTVVLGDVMRYVPLGERKKKFRGIRVALAGFKEVFYFANVYSAIVVPELVKRTKPKFLHRKDLVREFLSSVEKDNLLELDYSELWNFFLRRGLYVKDGMLHKIMFAPNELYDGDGLSSVPKGNYSCALLVNFDHERRLSFFYRGYFLVYYDKERWEYRNGYGLVRLNDSQGVVEINDVRM